MRIEINTEEKTIIVKSEVKISELIEWLKSSLSDYKEYKLRMDKEVINADWTSRPWQTIYYDSGTPLPPFYPNISVDSFKLSNEAIECFDKKGIDELV